MPPRGGRRSASANGHARTAAESLPRSGQVSKYHGIDEMDAKIIDILIADGRITYAELARRLNITRAAVRERVKKLQERGIIEGFSAIVNPRKLGRNLSVFFEIDVEPQYLVEVAKTLAQNENVLVVNQTTGPSTLHVHAILIDNDDLGEFLQNMVYKLKGVTMVKTYILLVSYKSKFGGLRISGSMRPLP